MASQARINAYMERHKIGPLFEDLMNKVLRDMPEEPLIYILRAMYKKAGIEIPQGIRYGGLRKSTSELNKSSSPERPLRSAVTSGTAADTGASRDYERPWATSPTRCLKPNKSEDPTGSKHRPEWNPDNKVKSSFDELWGDSDLHKKDKNIAAKLLAAKRSATKPLAAAVSAWAALGLGEDVKNYTSPLYQSKKQNHQEVNKVSEEDLLASEIVPRSTRFESISAPSSSVIASSSHRRKMDATKHKQELSQLLSQVDHTSDDSGLGGDWGRYNEDDDAIELLENANDLKQEGVKNIPESGYKLSRNLRYREDEPKVKLNINVNPMSYSPSSWQDNGEEMFSSPETERSSPVQKESEDEFESVSQVTGPRQPVWKLPKSGGVTGDMIPLRPPQSLETPPHSVAGHRKYTEKSLYATTSTRYGNQTVGTAANLAPTAKTWSAAGDDWDDTVATPRSARSLRSESSTRGWHLPDDTEVASVRESNQRVKGGARPDPRAY